MPINPRPRTLTDVFTKLFDQGTSIQIPSPGQIVHYVILTRGGVTNGGLAAVPSIARATTWIAVGDGTGTPAMGDTALFHETARAPVLPPLSLVGQTIAIAELPAVRGDGPIFEVGCFGPGPGGANPATLALGSGTLYTHGLIFPVLKYCDKVLGLEWVEG